MNEVIKASADPVGAPEPDGMPSGAGAMLRAAREAQGLHIAMLAGSLKIPVKKLEALEADHYADFPDTFFVRALASSVCRALKIDPAPVLRALPRSDTPKIKTDASGLNASFNDGAPISSKAFLSYFSRPSGMAILAIFVSIFLIAFFPKGAPLETAVPATSNGNSEAVPAPQVAPGTSDSAVQPIGLADPLSTSVGSVVAQAVTVEAPSFAGASSPNSSVPLMSAPLVPVMSGNVGTVVTLRARGASWVEVIDASGVLRLRQTLQEGEVVPVSGALPLAVVIGRADLVSVFVRGQALDTTAMTNNNVARFEVK